jgi:hypothetical protein
MLMKLTSAIRGDIDCVLADLSHDCIADQQRVPFPEFGVDIVFRKGKKAPLQNAH